MRAFGFVDENCRFAPKRRVDAGYLAPALLQIASSLKSRVFLTVKVFGGTGRRRRASNGARAQGGVPFPDWLRLGVSSRPLRVDEYGRA